MMFRHVETMMFRMKSWDRQLELAHGLNLWGEVNVDHVVLVVFMFQSVCFDVLLHVISLDESLFAVWALVRFISSVNLPVSVQTTGIC